MPAYWEKVYTLEFFHRPDDACAYGALMDYRRLR